MIACEERRPELSPGSGKRLLSAARNALTAGTNSVSNCGALLITNNQIYRRQP
jgi:hypothetical protein